MSGLNLPAIRPASTVNFSMDAPAPISEAREAQKTLIEALTALGTAGVDPSTADRHAVQQQLSDLLQRTPTVALLPALNAVIVPGRVPEAARIEFMSQLAMLPMRKDGVRAALEFVFSVHPSNTGQPAGAAAPQKEGAQITPEALKMATRLLASPAQRVAADHWFRDIAPQLLELLDGRDGLDLAKVAAYVIGFGILGRKSFGAPGMPGWVYFAEPMLRCIDPTTSQAASAAAGDDDEVVDLRKNAAAVLVSDQGVAQGLRRLQTLIISHPNPGLTRRLLSAVVLPLWALSSWTNAPTQCEDDYCLPARNLLKIYLKIATSPDKVMPIVRDLLFEGRRDAGASPQWEYQLKDAAGNSSSSSICIVSAPSTPAHPAEVLQTRWNEIGPKSDALIDLLASISTDDEEISSIFLDLFGRWLVSRKPKTKPAPGIVLIKEEDEDDRKLDADSNPLADVLEGSILQKMMEKFPEKLAGRPDHIFELVEGLLSQIDGDALSDDETLPVLLSLLNLVVTSPGFRRAKADAKAVQSIEASLETVGQASGSDAADENAKTARNLLLFLKYRDELEDPDAPGASAPATATAKQQIEDRKTYSLAMSYIMQADSPPPVRSEGLHLLQGLIQANSSVLDIPSLLVLMSSLLGENEDYVNLRVIKIFSLVANRHPKSTTKELLDHYVDAAETKSVDTRLRFGEALLQVVQRLGETFAGDTAQQVGAALLETAGRRGHRPKTEAKQARDARMQELKNKRTPAGGDGNDGDAINDDPMDIDDALLTDEEKHKNEILSRIVDGWGSKRGSEDVRIRASALSILGAGIEVNIGGLGATLASGAVDLSLHVLTMETAPETGILRRAAIILILGFVRALHEAREANRRLGFGLTQQSQDDILRILQYVAGTDEDGLVKQHAADVIESLENWQVSALMPRESDAGAAGPFGGLAKLAGLSINPAHLGMPAPSPSTSETLNGRPRIEEIE